MATHLKYLISLLLILGLTFNDGFGHIKSNSSSYHQSYKTAPLKRFRNKKTTLFTSKKSTLLKSEIIAFFFTSISSLKSYSNQIQIVLELQKSVHLQINSIKIQQTFLSKIFASSNSLPLTYIA